MFLKRAVILSGLLALSATPALAEDLTFKLINHSDANVDGFYVSHSGTNDWEENLLSGGYLAPGYEVDVMINDGRRTCTYDIRVEFDDKSAVEDYEMDLCDLGEYTVE